jgi:ectoine hydroxylase-related dioxygenase (phytanoyl-CoA dioxygenase family)
LPRLVDCTENLGDPALLRERIAEDGCFLARGVIDPAAIDAAAAAVRDVGRRQSWIGPAGDIAVRPGPAKRSAELYDMTTRLQRLEAVHRLAFDAGLQSLMESLIGEPAYVHPCKAIRVQWPQALGGVPVLPHRDFTEIQCVEDCFVTWIPLTPCPASKGGLRLFPGTQNDAVPTDEPPAGAGAGVQADLGPGDVIVFHSLLLHQGMPNETDELRLSVDFRWQSVHEPRQEDAMLPHRYPDIPGWDELTAGWETTRWIEAPPARLLARVPDEQLRPCASRFVRRPSRVRGAVPAP